MSDKKKVLFLCTHNSCRSQMAEALLNSLFGDRYEGYSAGITPTRINPYAVEVMKEIGIDLSKHYSKSINSYQGFIFDYVVTVCDNAKETCPFFPGKKILHKNFKDPSNAQGSVEEILNQFRIVREQIKDYIKQIFGTESEQIYG